ncbi:RHS repeat-associated core domain-containing protein [Dyadobacter sp. 32]|uniref:RHS repeat domain-containing protein n=1 Tax=Dyadobacter sp. 32 TaxID=538966 RepID=UPI0011EBF358
MTMCSGAVTDNLTYNYSTWGNRLFSVEDASTNNNGVKTGTSSFGYDNNGNMTADGTKGAAISYNLLNLPAQVVLSSPSRTVQYTYDASGSKLKMSSPSAGTLYAGAFEYTVNGTLLRIGLEEGQLVRNSSGTYELNYYIRDHLGNVRQVLKEDQQVLQETQYYAFGLPVVKDGNDAANKYLYNGKEKQPETGWLDYGARMYMAEIGRWGVVDPLSEISREFSPFVYGNDNPILMIDPDGMRTTYNWKTGAYINERGENVGFDQAKEEYGIGGGGCPPNCPQNVAKADATERAQSTVTPQIANGAVQIPQREQGTLSNADSRLQPHEQNLISGLSIALEVGAGEVAILKAGKIVSLFKVAKAGLTNSQLIQKSATLAERAIGETGGVAGTKKHQYATSLIDRYQSLYGNRGLLTNNYFNNGVNNRGFLDVLDKTNGIIYDFKFGKAVMRPTQFQKYTRNFQLPIQIIRP